MVVRTERDMLTSIRSTPQEAAVWRSAASPGVSGSRAACRAQNEPNPARSKATLRAMRSCSPLAARIIATGSYLVNSSSASGLAASGWRSLPSHYSQNADETDGNSPQPLIASASTSAPISA